VIGDKLAFGRAFGRDVGCAMFERVRDVIEKRNDVKVNTVINGEYVIDDKLADKN